MTVREILSSASIELEEVGYTILRNVFNKDELEALRKEIIKIYEEKEPDIRHPNKLDYDLRAPFRYECLTTVHCLNQLCPQKFLHNRTILGEDCHIIANTCWRNPPGEEERMGIWHLDGGLHSFRSNKFGLKKYPTRFAIGAHIF